MKRYQLKPNVEAFTVVDGPLAGQTFIPGIEYENVPEGDKGKFRRVRQPAAQQPRKAAPKTAAPVDSKDQETPESDAGEKKGGLNHAQLSSN